MNEKGQRYVWKTCRLASLVTILLVLGTPFVPQALAEKVEIRVIIPGVTDSLPEGAIIADSFSWGVAPASSSSGRSGAVNVHDFLIKKNVDASSPSFFRNCVSGAHYSKVTIEMRKAGSSGRDFVQFTLMDVIISSLSLGGSRGSDEPEETMSLVYGSIVIQYQQQQPGELDCLEYPICVARLPRS